MLHITLKNNIRIVCETGQPAPDVKLLGENYLGPCPGQEQCEVQCVLCSLDGLLYGIDESALASIGIEAMQRRILEQLHYESVN
jgi:hypothetical protein